MLVPPAQMMTREAWFVFGKIATGKSTIWDTVAKAYRETDTPGQFHVISTEPERAYVIVEQHPDWSDNVTIYTPERTFESLLAVSQQAKLGGQKHLDDGQTDWLIVDSIGACNDWVRNNWFLAHHGQDWKGYQIDHGGAAATKTVESHHWTQMNQTYMDWIIEYVMEFPGHRMATAQAEPLAQITAQGGDWDKGHTRDTYGRFGMKPVGFKLNDFYFHSEWFANRTRDNRLTLTTIKDKPGRAWLDDQEVLDTKLGGFVVTYLQAVAGWTISGDEA